jgi:preprotein translocase subunit Sss1
MSLNFSPGPLTHRLTSMSVYSTQSPHYHEPIPIKNTTSVPLHRLACIDRVPPRCLTHRNPLYQATTLRNGIGAWWIGDWTLAGWLIAILHTVIPAAYGAVHLIAWSWAFPSPTESLMWKIACFVIIGTALLVPALVIVAGWIYVIVSIEYQSDSQRWIVFWSGVMKVCGVGLCLVLFMGYLISLVAARAFLLVEAFVSLRRVEVGVYETPEWNYLDLIPHI